MPDTVVESVTVQKGELRIIYLFRDEGMGGGGGGCGVVGGHGGLEGGRSLTCPCWREGEVFM